MSPLITEDLKDAYNIDLGLTIKCYRQEKKFKICAGATSTDISNSKKRKSQVLRWMGGQEPRQDDSSGWALSQLHQVPPAFAQPQFWPKTFWPPQFHRCLRANIVCLSQTWWSVLSNNVSTNMIFDLWYLQARACRSLWPNNPLEFPTPHAGEN